MEKQSADRIRPSKSEVRKYQKKWESSGSYAAQEKALLKLFGRTCPGNGDLDDVLIKVAALNAFYKTHILALYAVAKNIVRLKIDKRLASGDPSVVADIANVEVAGGKKREFYSFATKYCGFHNPEAYPIFDSFVEKMLIHLKKTDGFARFKNSDLREYSLFKDIFAAFRSFYKLTEFKNKEIDRYLWQAGNAFFSK